MKTLVAFLLPCVSQFVEVKRKIRIALRLVGAYGQNTRVVRELGAERLNKYPSMFPSRFRSLRICAAGSFIWPIVRLCYPLGGIRAHSEG